MGNFRAGHILGFHRPVQGAEKNETVEVLQAEGKRLIVRNARGKTRTVTPKHAKTFAVFERRMIEIAPGDKLLLTANRRAEGVHVTNREIVVVTKDEATSNIDTESEQLIQASMATLLAGRTTFVIAHRLSTVRRADLILLLEDGRIIERGDHEQLMQARGTYHAMVLRQMESAGQDAEQVLH